MIAGGFTLCRISRREAEHLMMAPAMAGGWVAVDPDVRDSVVEAMGGPWAGNWADFLALLPSSWDDACRRPVTPAQVDRILEQLDRSGRRPVESDDGRAARDIARRVRAHRDLALTSDDRGLVAQAVCS